MRHSWLFVVGLVGIATSAYAEEKKYTLADLKALVEQKAYMEAVQHMADVAPAERNAEWTDLAGRASAGLVSGATADQKLMYMLTIDQSLPGALKSPKYLAVRADEAGA